MRAISSEFAVTPRKKKQRYAEDFVIDQPEEGWVKLSPGKSDESSDGNAVGSNFEVLKRRISEQTADANAFKSTIGSDVDMAEMQIAKLRNLMGARPSGALTSWEDFERMSLEVVTPTESQVLTSQLKESAASASSPHGRPRRASFGRSVRFIGTGVKFRCPQHNLRIQGSW
jgi:hypothetical protein